MRLSSKEQKAITSAVAFYLSKFEFRLLLFGSRTDDLKKGGDIDLLIVVPAKDKDEVIELKNKIRLKIFENIPEQRIDLTVATENEIQKDQFLNSIISSAIELFSS